MRAIPLLVGVLAVVTAACGGSPSSTAAAPVESTTTTAERGVTMELSSPSFDHESPIPERFTCDGDDVSPELHISGIPGDTSTLVLIMDDPDAPGGTWDHWVSYDIEPIPTIPENVGPLGVDGLNSWKEVGYGGPCPPSGTHRYFFRVLALDASLDLGGEADKGEVLAAAEGHVLSEAILMGTYAR
jgi:Raf kinase inhibitor-like YbhB/YbcL family protein